MRLKGFAFCLMLLLACAWAQPADAAPQDRTPGETSRIRELRFNGNKSFSDDRLRAVLGMKSKSKFALFSKPLDLSRIEVERMAEELTLFYRRQGYFEARVEALVKPDGSAAMTIAEGEPCRIGKVSLNVLSPEGEAGPSSEYLRPFLSLGSGEAFSVDKYEAGAVALTQKLKDSGYPFAEVSPHAEIDLPAHSAAVIYEVKPGAKAVFGQVTFAGIIHTEEKILRRALSFKPGETYRQSLVDESQEALYKMGLFESVVIVPKKPFTSGTVPVLVRVKEGRHHRVRASVGYSTDEGPRGMAGWETIRLNDKVLTLGVESRISDLQTQVSTYLRRPYVFDHRTSFLSDLAYGRLREAKFTYRSLKARSGLDFVLTKRLTFACYGTVERVLQVSPDRDLKKAIDEGARDVATIASVASSLTWNSTDKPFTPRSGSILSFTLEPSQVIGTHVHFEKTTLEGRHYFGLGQETVLALRLKLGGILSCSPVADIPVTRRFYAGGSSSVRGYGYNSLGPLSDKGVLLGGNGLVEASTELRFPLKGSLTGVAFVDAGNATPKAFSLKGAEIKIGAGVGVRYTSPVGPVGVDIAWKLEPYALDRTPYLVHFFIGYAF
jgi:outer membrane protein assembly complex protein YaeT